LLLLLLLFLFLLYRFEIGQAHVKNSVFDVFCRTEGLRLSMESFGGVLLLPPSFIKHFTEDCLSLNLISIYLDLVALFSHGDVKVAHEISLRHVRPVLDVDVGVDKVLLLGLDNSALVEAG